MAILFTNNASSTLANTLSVGATTAVLATGGGALFPSPGASDSFLCTLEDTSGNTEVVSCTSRTGDSLTIVRAQENTTAREFAAGSRVEIRVTAGVLNSLLQTSVFNTRSVIAGDGLTGGGDFSADRTLAVGTPATLTSATTNAVTADSHTHAVTFPDSPIPAGTIMLFQQTTAPTGWTKLTSFNDRALRVVSGTASTGGSISFSASMASRAINGTISAESGHTHSAGSLGVSLQRGRFDDASGDYRPFVAGTAFASGAAGGFETKPVSGTSGTGSSHSHTFTGTALNMAVQYVDVILASKN